MGMIIQTRMIEHVEMKGAQNSGGDPPQHQLNQRTHKMRSGAAMRRWRCQERQGTGLERL